MSEREPGTVTQEKRQAPPFEKQVVRLPDGRELTYYWFPQDCSSAPGKTPSRPAPGEER